MTTLDQQIRAQLIDDAAEQDDAAPVLAALRYQDALRAVLDVEPHASTQARFVSDQAWFDAGQEAYRLQVREAIAWALGITQETPNAK